MLESIQLFFQRMLAEEDEAEKRPVTLALATTAVLCEIICADERIDPRELTALKQMLMTHFTLSEEAVDELLALAQLEAGRDSGVYQFAHLINQHYDYNNRVALVMEMWRLAYADSRLVPHEKQRVRRFADLLKVSHGDFVQCKLHVQEEFEQESNHLPAGRADKP
ncbi:tellurite resistance TerB family protein [Phytohalomonas tamaricis]|uniref:tellurite resistance TerB family protein n=1 Tax=Phytohalomonas tamaricis TaxID=2081032 RepID=UPI000D0B2B80|nr:TerB family tellurite resistance protein [Phytohalomonas tamaricis]